MVTQIGAKATLSLVWELPTYILRFAPLLTLFACAALSLLNCKKKKKNVPSDIRLPPGVFPQTPNTATTPSNPSMRVPDKELLNGLPDDGKKGEKKQDAAKTEEPKKEPEPVPKPTAASKENAKEPATKDNPPKSNPILSNPLVTPVTDENPSAQKNANGEKEPGKSTADNKDGGSVKTLQGTQSEADRTQES